MAIYRSIPGFKGRTFKLCVLTRADFNFCVRSSPLRGEQSEKAESCRENLWNEIYLNGLRDRNRHKNRAKGAGKLGLFMSRTQTLTSPPREGEPAGTDKVGADVVLLHGCPQSCMPNPVECLFEVYEDMVEVLLVLEIFLT